VCTAEVRQIVYLGSAPSIITELENGGRPVLYQQNAPAAADGGEEVLVAWDVRNRTV
jgi:TOBE domain-containing protein